MLDRQVDFLLRQPDSASFLIQVEPFLRALRTESRLAAYLDDALEDVVAIIDAMEDVDAKLTAELLVLRQQLVELRPDADDSDWEPPSDSESRSAKLQAGLSYRGTLAYFDKSAAQEPEPFDADGKGGLAKTLLGILQNKDAVCLYEVEAAAARESEPHAIATEDPPTQALSQTVEDKSESGPDPLEAWRRRLGNVQRRYDFAVRLLRLRVRTSSGLAPRKVGCRAQSTQPAGAAPRRRGEGHH